MRTRRQYVVDLFEGGSIIVTPDPESRQVAVDNFHTRATPWLSPAEIDDLIEALNRAKADIEPPGFHEDP